MKPLLLFLAFFTLSAPVASIGASRTGSDSAAGFCGHCDRSGARLQPVVLFGMAEIVEAAPKSCFSTEGEFEQFFQRLRRQRALLQQDFCSLELASGVYTSVPKNGTASLYCALRLIQREQLDQHRISSIFRLNRLTGELPGNLSWIQLRVLNEVHFNRLPVDFIEQTIRSLGGRCSSTLLGLGSHSSTIDLTEKLERRMRRGEDY